MADVIRKNVPRYGTDNMVCGEHRGWGGHGIDAPEIPTLEDPSIPCPGERGRRATLFSSPRRKPSVGAFFAVWPYLAAGAMPTPTLRTTAPGASFFGGRCVSWSLRKPPYESPPGPVFSHVAEDPRGIASI